MLGKNIKTFRLMRLIDSSDTAGRDDRIAGLLACLGNGLTITVFLIFDTIIDEEVA
ncbi:MAG: hypothetical protein ACMUJM_08940 [bacterium]